MSKELFLGSVMAWCFKFGCEVTLRNKAHNRPVMDPLKDPRAVGEFHERQADGTIIDMAHRTNHRVIEIPELVFSKGDKHFSLSAYSWDELMRRFEYEYKRIYMELSVPLFVPVTPKKNEVCK